MQKTIRTAVLLGTFGAAVGLAGCAAPFVIGTAAITGSAAVMTDRRTTGNIVNDSVIEKRLPLEIMKEIGDENHHITVTSYDGRVLLSGEIATESEKASAQRIASASQDVTAVVNELAVMAPSTVSERLSDSMLATKVRSSIIGNKEISLNQMKVVAERGIVYLMGVVTREEADKAAKTAAAVDGVLRVVLCFNIETQEQIDRRLQMLKQKSKGDPDEP